MLAVVKKRRTNKRLFEIKGEIPNHIIDYFRHEYGSAFQIVEDAEQELVDVFETDWFKKLNRKASAGESIRIYRQNFGITQTDLGKQLGNYSKQYISDLENSRRSISKEVAKKLSKIFNVPLSRFI